MAIITIANEPSTRESRIALSRFFRPPVMESAGGSKSFSLSGILLPVIFIITKTVIVRILAVSFKNYKNYCRFEKHYSTGKGLLGSTSSL